MHVYLIEGETIEAFSTARKAIESCLKEGMGEYQVYAPVNQKTGKQNRFPLSNIKRGIQQLHVNGYLTASLEGGELSIIQVIVQ